MNCVLEGKNISVKANGRVILDNVSFAFGPGLNAIVGPNGAGKSTLLKAIAGLTGYTGEIRFCGSRIESLRGRASYMPATPVVDPLATVRDVLEAGLYGTSLSVEAALGVLEEFLPLGYSSRRFLTLSSGEQRLVCIARALARNSRVVLLDEPLSFLDVKNQVKILNYIKKYAERSKAIVLAAIHEIHYLHAFQRIMLLDKGKACFQGTTNDLKRELIENIYDLKLLEVNEKGYRGFIPIIS